MNAQCESTETNGIILPTMPGSDDSDEDSSQDEQPITSWNDLSIIERVGLNSLEMSEKDVEVAFCQITLAFRCDQYTLKQRLQAEEHARNLAEENVQLELARGRETLEILKALCMDSRRSTILQKLELSLDILGGTVERISNTAEVLGAVHQEARVSRAVELMVAHVENLRQRYERNLSELEEARRQIQLRQSCRNIQYTSTEPDPEENSNDKKLHKQAILRRRVSSSIITSQKQEKKKKDSKKRGGKKSSSVSPSPCQSSESSFCVNNNDSCSTDDRTVVDPSEAPEVFEKSENEITNEPPPPAVLAVEAPPEPKPQSSPTKQVTTANVPGKNSTLETLRQRPRGRSGLSKKRAEKRSQNLSQRPPADKCGLQCKSPGTVWMYRCRWALLSLYIFVLFCFFTMIYFLLMLNEEPESGSQWHSL